MDINDFRNVYVINLAKRKDRYKQFIDEYKRSELPWNIKVYEACDYLSNRPPHWFGSGKFAGAYGCMCSHRNLLQAMVDNDWENILIFEDDCTFVDKAKERIEEAIKELPDDWGFFYLGGQYNHRELEPFAYIKWPFLSSNNLIRAYNVNRTHAYAVNKKYAKKILCYLNSNNLNGRPPHIDHQYGYLQEKEEAPVYCIYPFVCGQRASFSDVCGKAVSNNIWNINVMGTEKESYFGIALSDFSVGYGDVGLNGQLGYEGKKIGRKVVEGEEWNTISVHAPSDGKINAFSPIEIYGVLNTDLNAVNVCTAKIDDNAVGTVRFAGDRTDKIQLPAGEHRLSFSVNGSNGGAHTIWAFRTLADEPLEQASVAVANTNKGGETQTVSCEDCYILSRRARLMKKTNNKD